MPQFEKGHEKLGGIKKGTKQSYGPEVRDALAKLSRDYVLSDNVKGLKADLDSMRPIDRAQTMERYLKYWLPTMGTVSVKGQEGDEPIQITVTYNSPDPKSVVDDDENGMDYSEKD
jgi:hypothetical protein